MKNLRFELKTFKCLPSLRVCRNYSETANQQLQPYFITGLVDAEGCFSFTILKNNNTIGWAVRPSFHIAIHRKDRALLESIQAF